MPCALLSMLYNGANDTEKLFLKTEVIEYFAWRSESNIVQDQDGITTNHITFQLLCSYFASEWSDITKVSPFK